MLRFRSWLLALLVITGCGERLPPADGPRDGGRESPPVRADADAPAPADALAPADAPAPRDLADAPPSDVDGPPDAAQGDAPGPQPRMLGRIEVFERDERYTADGIVFARFRLGGLPEFHHRGASDRSCRAFHFTEGRCPAGCPGICASDDTCHRLPLAYDPMGTVRMQGLAVPLALSPQPDHGHYLQFGLPADLFQPGQPVAAMLAANADPRLASLRLATSGVSPVRGHNLLDTGDDYQLDVAPGAALTVRWTPDAQDPDTRVRLLLNSPNRGHDQPYDAIIECDAEDRAGELTVTAALLATFPKTAGFRNCVRIDCPRSVLMRYRRAEMTLPEGQVELLVGSQLLFYLAKP